MASPPLEVFKTQLGGALGTQVSTHCFPLLSVAGWMRDLLRSPPTLSDSVIIRSNHEINSAIPAS